MYVYNYFLNLMQFLLNKDFMSRPRGYSASTLGYNFENDKNAEIFS